MPASSAGRAQPVRAYTNSVYDVPPVSLLDKTRVTGDTSRRHLVHVQLAQPYAEPVQPYDHAGKSLSAPMGTYSPQKTLKPGALAVSV